MPALANDALGRYHANPISFGVRASKIAGGILPRTLISPSVADVAGDELAGVCPANNVPDHPSEGIAASVVANVLRENADKI